MKTHLLIAAVCAVLLTACGSAAPAAPTAAPMAASEPQIYAIVPQESQVTYEVGEVFFNQNNRYNLAVGVTRIITGQINLDRNAPRNSSLGTFTVDISAFQSDSSRRDNAIRNDWLESARFPLATFTATGIEGLPATYTDSQEITIQITGDLTVRETTRPVTFAVKGKIVGEEMTGTATTQIKMTDFGFQPPDILNVLKAEDDVKITFTFVARPVA